MTVFLLIFTVFLLPFCLFLLILAVFEAHFYCIFAQFYLISRFFVLYVCSFANYNFGIFKAQTREKADVIGGRLDKLEGDFAIFLPYFALFCLNFALILPFLPIFHGR